MANNRRLHSTYCTVEATDTHKASHSLSVTGGLLVSLTCGVCMQPMRRFVVGVERGLLCTLTAHMVAMNSVFTTGAKRGRNAVG